MNSELQRNWKCRTEEIERIGIHREAGTIFAPSIPFLECQMYTSYSSSAGSVDRCSQNIGQYEARRQVNSTLFPTNESVLQFFEPIHNSSAEREDDADVCLQ